MKDQKQYYLALCILFGLNMPLYGTLAWYTTLGSWSCPAPQSPVFHQKPAPLVACKQEEPIQKEPVSLASKRAQEAHRRAILNSTFIPRSIALAQRLLRGRPSRTQLLTFVTSLKDFQKHETLFDPNTRKLYTRLIEVLEHRAKNIPQNL